MLILQAILLSSCNSSPKATPTVHTNPGLSTLEYTPTYNPTPTLGYYSFWDNTENNLYNYLPSDPPAIWTTIKKDDITIYPFDWVSDYTYDSNGSLWMVGGFGVIKKDLDGQKTWYSMLNGLPTNRYSAIAISPSGEIWIGGPNNSLFRFEGKQWVNEGEKLPQPFDGGTNYICYSKTITSIDFDLNGSVWVMNNGIELYRRVYDQWINVYFPKGMLPSAGGGACPMGFYVQSNDDITIKLNGCCMSEPFGFHFDGKTWIKTDDYGVVDELIFARHQSDINSQQPLLWSIKDSLPSEDWPFNENRVLPDFTSSSENTMISTDENGVIWINNLVSLYRNTGNGFEDIQAVGGKWSVDDPDLKQSNVLGFNSRVFFYEEGKRPYYLPWAVDTDIIWEDISYFVDQRDIVWFYHAEKGLVNVDHGEVKYLGHMPVFVPQDSIGGIFTRSDGRVWVGTNGAIWEYNNDDWHQFILTSNELLEFFTEDENGVIYAATDTGVYRIENGKFTYHNFLNQDQKPFVLPENSGISDCAFNKRYTIIVNCPDISLGELSPDYHYKAIFIGMQQDGSVIYINNHVVAKLEENKWKSYLFDTITISSAAVDLDGRIWIYSISDGLLSFESDIFDDYPSLIYP